MSGSDLAAARRILRHSHPKLTTKVCAHLAPDYLRAEVDRLSCGPTRTPKLRHDYTGVISEA